MREALFKSEPGAIATGFFSSATKRTQSLSLPVQTFEISYSQLLICCNAPQTLPSILAR